MSEIKAEEIIEKKSGLFSMRMREQRVPVSEVTVVSLNDKGEVVEIKDERYKDMDTVFVLKGLPTVVRNYITSICVDDKGNPVEWRLSIELFRFGCQAVEGATDGEGEDVELAFEDVEILFRKYKALKYDYVDALPDGIIGYMAGRVWLLSNLSEAEARRLDFTTASGSKESNVTKPAPAPKKKKANKKK